MFKIDITRRGKSTYMTSYSKMNTLKKKNIFGIDLTDTNKEIVLEYIVKSLKNSQKKYYIVTPNPELLVIAQKDPKYRKVLNGAKLALIDGMGIILASKFLRKGLKERITGVDLVESLCSKVSKKPITVGFLGGGAGVAERTAECLRQKYPGLKVVFAEEEWSFKGGRRSRFSEKTWQTHVENDAHSGLFQKQTLARWLSESLSRSKNLETKKNEAAFSSLSNDLPSSSVNMGLNYTPYSKRYLLIDILFVAFGSPKQEIWISENLDKLPVKVAIGVGGAFDFISGKVKRAPVWVRKIGLEWLFRLIIQPWRIKRQLALLEFVYLVLKEKLF